MRTVQLKPKIDRKPKFLLRTGFFPRRAKVASSREAYVRAAEPLCSRGMSVLPSESFALSIILTNCNNYSIWNLGDYCRGEGKRMRKGNCREDQFRLNDVAQKISSELVMHMIICKNRKSDGLPATRLVAPETRPLVGNKYIQGQT